MLRLFDFFLSLTAIIALLVTTYLFTADTASQSNGGLMLQKEDNNLNLNNVSSITSTPVSSIKWQYIVIHHSSTKSGNAQIFDRYHREEMKMPEGLSYHFVIGNGTKSADGEVETGERWHRKIPGPHCFDPKMNEQSIGICLVGDFEKSKPTRVQINTLVDLLRKLQKDYQIPTDRIIGHKEVDKGKTDCPGKNFPWQEIKTRLNSSQIISSR